MIPTFPDSSICKVCGMPLAYDFILTRQPRGGYEFGSSLCSFCMDPRNRQSKRRKGANAAWALELILHVYCRKAPLERGLAKIVGHLPFLPPRLRTLTELIQLLPHRSNLSRYDAVILYSGGKDSSYMLLQLAKRRLKICAWMLNQGYQSATAIENAQKLCERLNVPLVIEEPERKRMDELFRFGFGIKPEDTPDLVRAVMTYGSACWPCFATIAARATTFCASSGAAFCFIGTQAGQNRLDVSGRPGLEGVVPRTEHLLDQFVGPLSDRVQFKLPQVADLLQRQPCSTFLLPYYEFVRKPEVEEQLAALRKVGWKMPHNTGTCSTNCMINELGRQVMRKRFGFDLYQIIDAHERRLGNRPPLAESETGAVPLDEHAVLRAARMIKLSEAEAQEFGIIHPLQQQTNYPAEPPSLCH